MTSLAVPGLAKTNEIALFKRLEQMAEEISSFRGAEARAIDLDGEFYFYIDVSKVLVMVGQLTRNLGENWNMNEHCKLHQFELMRVLDSAEMYLKTLQMLYQGGNHDED